MNSDAVQGPPAPDPQALVAPSSSPPSEVIRQQATAQDYVVLRMAVGGLILATAIALIGTIFLIWSGRGTPPDGVVAIGSAGVGALATMLVRPPQTPTITNVVDRRT